MAARYKILFKDVYHVIPQVLDAQGKTGYWLAVESGIDYSAIKSYIKGEVDPSLKTIFRIAKALNVRPRDLLND